MHALWMRLGGFLSLTRDSMEGEWPTQGVVHCGSGGLVGFLVPTLIGCKEKDKRQRQDTRPLAVEDDLGGMSGPAQHTLIVGRCRWEAEP